MGSAETMFMDGAPRETPPAQAPTAHAIKLVMLGQDGNPMGERVLTGESLEVGRNTGPPWDDDAYLDPNHATLTPAADGLRIDDSGSLNGVYLKLKERVELRDGDQFRVGQELLYYEDLPEPAQAPDGSERMGSPNPGYWGRVSVLVDPERAVRAVPIAGNGISIGRELGDMTFPSDGYVSGTHCKIIGDDSGVYLEDVGSSNGTYIRVRSGDTVSFGSLILIGQKLFQIEKP
jgi:pSer/pThr/pTyr-binding forkhead associated (FHA) protein